MLITFKELTMSSRWTYASSFPSASASASASASGIPTSSAAFGIPANLKAQIVHPGSICCALFSRGNGTFHWSLAVFEPNGQARKIHAVNGGGGAWSFESRRHDVLSSRTACVVVKIGEYHFQGPAQPKALKRRCRQSKAGPICSGYREYVG